MKIGIISQYYNSKNYGGNLQAFALQKRIENMGFSCEQICYDRKYKSMLYYLLRDIKHAKPKELPSLFINLGKYIVKCLLLFKDYVMTRKRRKTFSAFSESVPHSADKYYVDTMNSLNDVYDTFIVGSDCVWNETENPVAVCLSFAKKEKRKISYAASLGCSSIPVDWADKFLSGIKHFDSISVRESSIADELKTLIPEKEISVTVDPTLLFTADEWNSFLPEPKSKEKYAFIYILSEDEYQCKKAEEWAHSMGLKTHVFPHINNVMNYWQRSYGDIRDFTSGPLEFVSLIKNADVIITDSFHATVFSVLFHKPFFAFTRKTRKDFVGRVENFLDDTGLTSQLIDTDELSGISHLPKTDFSYSDSVIEKKREESLKYLKEKLY